MNKLFIIGLPRTGTTSISAALLDYGFKVAHIACTKRAFELADVISDAPCFSDYRQLDKLFPNSKFIYLDRALDQWVPSMQRLLTKMYPHLNLQTGSFDKVLKRSFNDVFKLSTTQDPFSPQHLEACYLKHQAEVLNYFSSRNDLLQINISQEASLAKLLGFLDINTNNTKEFPHLNIGKQVDHWKTLKHPNKINSFAAGLEQRKFFDYE